MHLIGAGAAAWRGTGRDNPVYKSAQCPTVVHSVLQSEWSEQSCKETGTCLAMCAPTKRGGGLWEKPRYDTLSLAHDAHDAAPCSDVNRSSTCRTRWCQGAAARSVCTLTSRASLSKVYAQALTLSYAH